MGITEHLVQLAEADPDMDYGSRTSLARDLLPLLPSQALRRIGRVTTTFKDVFAVAAAPRLGEITSEQDADSVLDLINTLAETLARSHAPSPEAVIVAWAGGLLHFRQARRALAVLGQSPTPDSDPDLKRHQLLERVADPTSPRLAGQVAALADRDRKAMAAAVLDEALRITADSAQSAVEAAAATLAAHRVRGDLADRSRLPGVQRYLVAALETLGDSAAALEIASIALGDLPPDVPGEDRDWLAGAVLRLSARSPAPESQTVAALMAEAVSAGAALGLEAKVWAAVELLQQGTQRELALSLADQVATALNESAPVLGLAADQWRLLLAFAAGRAAYSALTGRLLAPLLNSDDEKREDKARSLLYACAGPGADTRLQVIVLEAELNALTDNSDDDRLRLHHALAANYEVLGEYSRALVHSQHELACRMAIQHPDCLEVLMSRGQVAACTGSAGDIMAALRLSRELLVDLQRILRPDHPYTLTVRGDIAEWAGRAGDRARALQLSRGLLADQRRVLGPDHPGTLLTRARVVFWTGETDDSPAALKLSRELLPDCERVFGPDHPSTLSARHSVALWTALTGDPAAALRLLGELLPSQQQVLGPDHPETFHTRYTIARFTGQRGNPAAALQILRELLPDRRRVLGPDHPDTLHTLEGIALWMGYCGDPGAALDVLRQVLSDRQRVLGPDHPDTLETRYSIAMQTAVSGDVVSALRLLRELLPDRWNISGPNDPKTRETISSIGLVEAMVAQANGDDGPGRPPKALGDGAPEGVV